MRLKIAVSVVRFRPWAPFLVRSRPATFENITYLPRSRRLPPTSERELTDWALDVEFKPRHLCKKIDIASADGAAIEAHVGGCQVERLDQAADVFQDERIGDRAVFPGDPPEARGDRDQDLR